jgi:ribosomal protein S18 acetylase RimI-like enzyme
MQTMAPPRIRSATADDLDAIRSVLARANEPFRGQVHDSLFASYLASALDVEGRLRDGELLAAELGGRIVGTITFYRDAGDEGMPVRFPAGTGGIRATAVDPVARGQGIGRALVEACIERAVASGATNLGLHTASFMVAAVALYERTGFRRTPALDFSWSQFFPTTSGADEPAIAYLRRIP